MSTGAITRRGRLTGLTGALGIGALLTCVAATAPAGAVGGSVAVVAYSTPKPAFSVLSQAFSATPAGQGVSISSSFGPSGTQATDVVDGLHADLVNLSLAPDMEKLVKAGLVSPSWNKNATHGFVTDSIVSFVVRAGNPKHIKTWADLIRPGVQVITPNPFSSGSAKWNLVAAYGAQLEQGKTKAQANAYLKSLLQHTVAQPTSASSALQTFLAGQGDVLLSYEDDGIYAQRKGEPITIVTPPQSVLIENPIAVTTNASDPSAAKAFVSYLLSPAGQRIWAQQGYRPVLPSVAAAYPFPKVKQLFTIGLVGGWTKVNTQFFDPTSGSVAQIEQSLGVSSSSG